MCAQNYIFLIFITNTLVLFTFFYKYTVFFDFIPIWSIFLGSHSCVFFHFSLFLVILTHELS